MNKIFNNCCEALTINKYFLANNQRQRESIKRLFATKHIKYLINQKHIIHHAGDEHDSTAHKCIRRTPAVTITCLSSVFWHVVILSYPCTPSYTAPVHHHVPFTFNASVLQSHPTNVLISVLFLGAENMHHRSAALSRCTGRPLADPLRTILRAGNTCPNMFISDPAVATEQLDEERRRRTPGTSVLFEKQYRLVNEPSQTPNPGAQNRFLKRKTHGTHGQIIPFLFSELLRSSGSYGRDAG